MTQPIPPKLQARIDHLRGVCESPPDHARPVAFMYRQSVANRQQTEKRIHAAREALAQAEVEHHRAVGAEAALCDAVLALVPLPVVVDPSDPLAGLASK